MVQGLVDALDSKQNQIIDNSIKISEVANLQTSLDAKPNSVNVYSKLDVDTLFSQRQIQLDQSIQNKANASTVFSKSEVNELLNTKQPVIEDNDLVISQVTKSRII